MRTSGASGGRRCQRSRSAIRLLKDADILDLEVSAVVVARSLNEVQTRTRAGLRENVQSEVSANRDVEDKSLRLDELIRIARRLRIERRWSPPNSWIGIVAISAGICARVKNQNERPLSSHRSE